MQKTLPADVKLAVIRDDSRRIRASLDSVQHELVLGAVLTVLIIYLFLNSWRSTVITGLALPISIISAFFIMWVFGFTVNTMTLLALRSEEHTSELQSRQYLVCRLLLEQKTPLR